MKEKSMNTKAVAAFIGTLLHGVTGTHMLHLSTNSYARHIALNELYDELGDLVDTVAEEHQGCYGVIDNYNTPFTYNTDPIVYVQGLYDFVEKNRKVMSNESHIQNNIDMICTLLARTLYKLKRFP